MNGLQTKIETLQDEYNSELIRMYRLTVDGRLQWRRISDCSFEMEATNDTFDNGLPNIVLQCCTHDYMITIDGDVIEASANLIKQLCDAVRQQNKLCEKYRILAKSLPKLQSIK